jgi:putative membrane protein
MSAGESRVTGGPSVPATGRYVATLAGLFAALFVALAIRPFDRHDWALENALVVVAVLFIALTWARARLSALSYTLLFLFLCLHEIGAHYTYSEVPYDAWWQALTGSTFNSLVGWERNNFDRVIHFAYGLLLALPIRELVVPMAGVRGFWSYFLPLDLVISSSALYELIEWGAAEFFGGDLGAAYLGTQGDVWDAHKDMALASGGALVAILWAWWWGSIKFQSLCFRGLRR